MRKTATSLLVCMAIYHFSNSQNVAADTSQTLGEVIVKAYEQNQSLRKVPSAINKVNKSNLERFSNTNILPALNSTPGVRMEERSPGSYRMNIRGSTLRSPFGVRNVKVYWDEIPFTDPGGNTYLNQLSYYNFNSIEVIKGPAGSLYGAGTGGAILINSNAAHPEPGLLVNLSYGSYDHSNINVQFNQGKDKFRNSFTYSHQQSDGYRDHTSMRRDIATWRSQITSGKKETLHFNFLYGDLYYQTPGALTKAEYQKNPQASRPAAGAFPSADGAKAAIYQKTWYGGFNNHFKFNDHFENSLIFYGALSKIKNPTFRNYEARNEPHFGGRTVFTWKPSAVNEKVKVIFGAEAQKGYFNIHTYQNVNGQPTTTLTNDDVSNGIWSIFAQTDLRLKYDINITAGLSINQSTIKIKRLSIPSLPEQKRSYKNEAAPRLAISKKIVADLYLYASVAKGFSPPTTAEVLPSTSVISTELNAEHGISYEVGFKSSWLQRRLNAEVNVFDYRLKNAIVQRRDATNGDYFVNAGSTKQRGIESQVSYLLLQRNSFINTAKLWASYTWNNFTYDDFKQLTNDFSGKKLPSVAKNTVASGLDISTKPGIYINLTYYYSDPIPLNDANTEFASSYNLLGSRIGWKKNLKKKNNLEFFAGIENAFDVTYSLGNDINAAGGRYYNAAPGRNYYGGVSLSLF